MIPASFSFLRDLANCPHKAYRRYLTRDLPFVETPELKEGKRVHKLLEDYLNSHGKLRLPVALETLAKPLADLGARAEMSLGMDVDRGPVGFWASPWARGKIDAAIIRPSDTGDFAFIADWKTGKVR